MRRPVGRDAERRYNAWKANNLCVTCHRVVQSPTNCGVLSASGVDRVAHRVTCFAAAFAKYAGMKRSAVEA